MRGNPQGGRVCARRQVGRAGAWTLVAPDMRRSPVPILSSIEHVGRAYHHYMAVTKAHCRLTHELL